MSGYFSDPDAAISHSVDTGEAVVYEPGSEVEAGLSAAEHSHPAYNVTVTLMKRRIGDVHSKLKKFANNPPTSVFRAAVMAALDEIAPVQDVPLMEGSVNLDRWQRLSGLLTERAEPALLREGVMMAYNEIKTNLETYLDGVTDDEWDETWDDFALIPPDKDAEDLIKREINSHRQGSWREIGNQISLTKDGFDRMRIDPEDLGIKGL